ncbi:MAG: hypothetical protein HY785_15545 [Oscillatoriophycideae cyanobacterium NC_groundwater_1537_Pr4_S-0.65um_50_18]|nr:hypothetical protein [Oscillatoriophycideae cyanobacterium NC_groundwater_1537_Pr4_S-0.65um_50_18]
MVTQRTQVSLGAIAIATALVTWSTPASAQTSDSSELCTFHNAVQQSAPESLPQLGEDELDEFEPEESELDESEPSSVAQATVITLGKIPDAPYVVAVLNQDDVTLDTVRQCVPDAFQTRSRVGTYIRAGAFPQRSTAEALSRYLRTLNLETRVIYLP